MFYAYVIKSLKDGTFYYGSSNDPEYRLENRHNQGKVKYTSRKMPWILIHKESFQTKSEAMQREKFFKSGQGREYLKSLLK